MIWPDHESKHSPVLATSRCLPLFHGEKRGDDLAQATGSGGPAAEHSLKRPDPELRQSDVNRGHLHAQKRPGSQLTHQTARLRLTSLEERVVAAIADRSKRAMAGRPQDKLHLVQLRAALHELVNEMTRDLSPGARRDDTCAQARTLIDNLTEAPPAPLVAAQSRGARPKRKNSRKKRRPHSGSVWTVSGGLPTLGKR
jgi:hypothetical protein